jgi:hypothetical protein
MADSQPRLPVQSVEDVAGFTTAEIGESAEWAAIVSTADENRINYCKSLSVDRKSVV